MARYSTAILKCPSGRYMLVGSVPAELHHREDGRPMVWETEQGAIDALLGIGCTTFQRADCSWYSPVVEVTPQGPQTLLTGTPQRTLPTTKLRPSRRQSDLAETPLFGQDQAARERSQEELPL